MQPAVTAKAEAAVGLDPREALFASLQHHPSPGPMLRRVLEQIDQLPTSDLAGRVNALWSSVVRSQVKYGLLFADELEENRLAVLLRSFDHPHLVRAAPELAELQRKWLESELSLDGSVSHFGRLMQSLAAGPDRENPHDYYARLFTWQDLLHVALVRPDLAPVVDAVHMQLHNQRLSWSNQYCGGYAYQGLEEAGVQGWKPSERRLAAYRIDELLQPTDRVLDIGANAGFLAVHLAGRVGQVDGIELNPFLVQCGAVVARHLGAAKVRLEAADFTVDAREDRYDAVFSLSNHHTTDHRLSMRFEEYILRCWSLLRPGGRLFFESHNVFGPGKGGPGDDGDLEVKFDIAERWFEHERSHMVRAFVPKADIDKLFVVLRRRDEPDFTARRTLDLNSARQRYLD